LAVEAKALGILPYLAEHDVQPGTDLAEKIQNAIRRCSAFVVLMSDNSVNAPYVREEIGFALASNKIVIPLVQPGIASESLAMLHGKEFISFDFAAPTGGLKNLNTALTRLVNEQTQREKDNALLVMAIGGLILIALHASNK
jgi:hypothetical protein